MMGSDIMRKLTTEQFIEKARAVHENRYDYSLVEYSTNKKKVRISCSAHGVFEQTPNNHLSGNGCPQCTHEFLSAKFRASAAEAIAGFRKTHGDKYDYSKMRYVGAMEKVEIICRAHGSFWQAPASHRSGRGCPRCKAEKNAASKLLNRYSILSRFKSVHGDKYGYDEVVYTGTKYPVRIECSDHGIFEQTPEMHIAGQGCPKCAHSYPYTQEQIIEKFIEVHGDTYGYENIVFNGVKNPIRIVCKKHGEFEQYASNHLSGRGCQKCGVETRQLKSERGVSEKELEVAEFITLLGVETQHGYLPDSDAKWTFDVIVPSHKLAVEFNGVYWHSYPRAHRGQHYHKRKNAEANGYRLITIWEDDWKHKRERMESLLRRAIEGPMTEIGARETTLVKVLRDVAKAFHEDHHVQDFRISTADQHYGLFDQADLVAVASFDKKGVLHRYTVLGGLSIAGGLQKCIKAFRGDFGDLPIVTYCDRDHFMGNLYRAAGFVQTGGTMTMSYVVGSVRQRREGYMKHKLPSLFGDVDMDQREIDICAEHGVYACWNSGTEKYELA
jgi:Zn finger protein HypA/HybF involved in hydrogenase expression